MGHIRFSPRGWRARIVIAGMFFAPVEAVAQRADDNATTSAEDAFGSSIGNESVGLYNPYEARGFSPIDAGNVRIEGLYFDQQDELSDRLVDNTRVRVGLTTLGYLFPAPTGIVDNSLRKPGDKRVISAVAGTGVYGGPYVELDTKWPLVGDKLGLVFGAARRHEEFFDGADGDFASVGTSLRWTPSDNVEVIPFFSRFHYWNEESAPLIISGGDYVPPRGKRRSFYSQDWADNKGHSQNHGVVAKTTMGAWQFQTGLFQSRFVADQGFTELLLGVTPTGQGNRIIIARQDQRFASTSGEVRASYNFIENKRKHVFHVALRGRDVNARSGGADVKSLGPGFIGVSDQEAPLTFNYGPHDLDEVKQGTVGVGYQGIWAGVGELSAGLQRTDYKKTNVQQTPVFVRSVRQDKPWLWNASAAWFVTSQIAVYGGYTKGLEESGNAPAEATNRFAVLPAILTRQVEAGARFSLTDKLKLVTGVFDVRKPYFAFDNTRFFRELGEVQHRGLEFSLTGEVFPNFTVVLGGVLMNPRVTGEPVERGEIGRNPVGQTGRTIRASFDYKVPWVEGLSIDGLAQNIATRTASVDNRVETPGRAVLDIGARYRFEVGGNATTVRMRWYNIFNKFGYRVLGDHTFQFNQARNVSIYLATDF
ncbi:MAG: TonB-dependent receptor [Rhodospirillaceae bacterium]|nr:TonB-dependent receptor [Rhodospirillaceae bacterium]